MLIFHSELSNYQRLRLVLLSHTQLMYKLWLHQLLKWMSGSTMGCNPRFGKEGTKKEVTKY